MFTNPPSFVASTSSIRAYVALGRNALLILCGLLFQTADAWAVSATLAWDASRNTSVIGYRIHYGKTSRHYTTRITVGKRTSYTIKGLKPGRHYFAVTAYTSRTESPLSKEVTKQIVLSQSEVSEPDSFVPDDVVEEGSRTNTTGANSIVAHTTDTGAPGNTRVRNANPVVDVQLNQSHYTPGDEVTAMIFRISNPGTSERRVETKNWLVTPTGEAQQLGNSGADGQFILPPGLDHDFGPAPILPIDGTLPHGSYFLNARLLDAVTGDLISEDFNPFTIGWESPGIVDVTHPSPDQNLYVYTAGASMRLMAGETVDLPYHVVENVGIDPVALELKMWLEVPGEAPIGLVSFGADSSLVLPPGASFALDDQIIPPAMNLVPGIHELRTRGIDPVTGRILLEHSTPCEVR